MSDSLADRLLEVLDPGSAFQERISGEEIKYAIQGRRGEEKAFVVELAHALESEEGGHRLSNEELRRLREKYPALSADLFPALANGLPLGAALRLFQVMPEDLFGETSAWYSRDRLSSIRDQAQALGFSGTEGELVEAIREKQRTSPGQEISIGFIDRRLRDPKRFEQAQRLLKAFHLDGCSAQGVVEMAAMPHESIAAFFVRDGLLPFAMKLQTRYGVDPTAHLQRITAIYENENARKHSLNEEVSREELFGLQDVVPGNEMKTQERFMANPVFRKNYDILRRELFNGRPLGIGIADDSTSCVETLASRRFDAAAFVREIRRHTPAWDQFQDKRVLLKVIGPVGLRNMSLLAKYLPAYVLTDEKALEELVSWHTESALTDHANSGSFQQARDMSDFFGWQLGPKAFLDLAQLIEQKKNGSLSKDRWDPNLAKFSLSNRIPTEEEWDLLYSLPDNFLRKSRLEELATSPDWAWLRAEPLELRTLFQLTDAADHGHVHHEIAMTIDRYRQLFPENKIRPEDMLSLSRIKDFDLWFERLEILKAHGVPASSPTEHYYLAEYPGTKLTDALRQPDFAAFYKACKEDVAQGDLFVLHSLYEAAGENPGLRALVVQGSFRKALGEFLQCEGLDPLKPLLAFRGIFDDSFMRQDSRFNAQHFIPDRFNTLVLAFARFTAHVGVKDWKETWRTLKKAAGRDVYKNDVITLLHIGADSGLTALYRNPSRLDEMLKGHQDEIIVRTEEESHMTQTESPYNERPEVSLLDPLSKMRLHLLYQALEDSRNREDISGHLADDFFRCWTELGGLVRPDAMGKLRFQRVEPVDRNRNEEYAAQDRVFGIDFRAAVWSFHFHAVSKDPNVSERQFAGPSGGIELPHALRSDDVGGDLGSSQAENLPGLVITPDGVTEDKKRWRVDVDAYWADERMLPFRPRVYDTGVREIPRPEEVILHSQCKRDR